jgi:hypothetical protein
MQYPRFLAVLALLGTAGCTIVQDVERIDTLPSSDICILEDSAVREGVLSTIRDELSELGCNSKILPSGADRNTCPVTLTYTAQWSWDLALYMSYARLRVYNDTGSQIGEAAYDARRGGGRLSKFITAEDKVRELIDELFAGKCN